MLTEAIKQNITSLSSSELESLCDEYLDKYGEYSEEKFIDELYRHKRITLREYKNVVAHEMIEFTSVIDVGVGNRDVFQQTADETGRDGSAGVTEGKARIPADLKGNDDDHFTVTGSIDEGAMGKILLAQDNKLNRKVAYKKIHAHVAEIPSYLGRFYREAQVTAQLQHPNIVPVYGMDTDNGSIGYAMKLIDGVTLKDHIRETQEQYVKNGKPDEYHTLHARLEHFLKVCDAMHYAHRKGVIHRDLKPLNIMIGSNNEVYVMDWGIAKTFDVDKSMSDDKTTGIRHEEIDESDKTQRGQVMGSPAYMSPEQAGGDPEALTHRSDLYSLGLILHELVTFHRAINGKDTDEIMLKAKRGIIDKPPTYSKQEDAQEQLLAIVRKSTEYLPEDRYFSVSDFADDIRRFMHGEAIKARPESTRQKIMRWVTHHRKAAVNVMFYSVLGICALTAAVLFQQVQTIREAQSDDTLTKRFVLLVEKRSQHIDKQFTKYESILESLSVGAGNLLNQGTIDKEPYYTDSTIADVGKGPPDFKFSEVYGFPVSVDYHAYVLAPGVNERRVKPILQRLNPMRYSFKSLISKSHNAKVENDDRMVREVIVNQGLPLAWAYVGLEEGILAEYPGKTGYPENFDPRQRPWYRETLDKTGINWLSPHVDVGGQGILLPCTNPIFDNDGKFIGIVGVKIALEYVRQKLMPIFGGVQGLDETYLLNDKAEIIITASEKSQSYAPGTLINSIDVLQVFPNEYVANRISRGYSGHYFYIERGREKIIAYQRLDSNGWYYVAKADVEELLDTNESR